MSPCFENVLAVVRKLAESGIPPDSTGLALLRQIRNLADWDKARSVYYAEAESLKIFDWAQQYRAAMSLYSGTVPVAFENAPFTPEAWEKLERQAAAMKEGFAEGDYLLDRLDVWILESYALPGECEVQAGDVVLDCGTYTGNTSLYFSRKAGDAGRVYGFEAAPATFEKYRRNMSGKPNVTPVQAAVCDVSGQVFFAGDAANAAIHEDGAAVPALRLDDFCGWRGLARVDFIKMDVEGAEARALNGARDVIRRHAPKMALAAYHQDEDIIRLPGLILGINPAYRFKLRHFSPVECETVLFCIPDPGGCGGGARPQWDLSAEDCTELVRTLTPLLLAGVEGYENSLAARFKAVEGMLGAIPRLDEENTRLMKENQALRQAVEKLLAERQAAVR
jgi:FkbM family methyltransferase